MQVRGVRTGLKSASAHLHSMQERIRTPHPPTPAPSCALTCHQNTTPDGTGAESHAQGMGGDTCGDPTLARGCTIHRAATAGRTRVNSVASPTLPCAPTTCFHIDLAGSETAELPVPFGQMVLARVQNTCLPQVRALEAQQGRGSARRRSSSRHSRAAWQTESEADTDMQGFVEQVRGARGAARCARSLQTQWCLHTVSESALRA